MIKGKIKEIDYLTAKEFLLPRHYSGRVPSMSFRFGWYFDGELKAVMTIGKPASPPLCKGVCGEEFSSQVYELNRLCRTDDLDQPLSYFVSKCLKTLKDKNLIIVSFSDTAMNHNGYIYQACNFLYTGCSKKRTDKYTEGNRHPRHYDNAKQSGLRKVRSAKHRYIIFVMKDKKIKKRAMEALRYKIEPYPKNANSNYNLGTYLEPEIIDMKLHSFIQEFLDDTEPLEPEISKLVNENFWDLT